MKRIFFIALSLLAVQSCHSDYVEELGDGYQYYFEGVSVNQISKQFRDENGKLVDIRVSRGICSFDSDKCFIVASRVEMDTLSRQLIAVEEDSIFEKRCGMEQFVEYWIIEKKKDELYGPLSYEEYRNKRIDLAIPDRLKLD